MKIPDIQINAEQENIWKEVQTDNTIKVDFQAIDDLFAVQDRPSSAKRKSVSDRMSTSSSAPNLHDVKDDVRAKKVRQSN